MVVLFGTNDSVLAAPGQYRVPVGSYEQNLREIVKRCTARKTPVILCTPPPILAEPYYTRHPKEYYEPEGGLEAILARYRDAVLRVAESTEADVLDLNAELAEDMSWVKPDGVHPSSRGERAIAAMVAEALQPHLPARDEAGPVKARVDVAAGASSVKGTVREALGGLRGAPATGKSVASEGGVLPVLGEYDVVVVGGGTGGAPAGISAARKGAKTLVIEYLHGLGGVATLGLIGTYYHGYRGGFTEEIDKGVASMGSAPPPKRGWNVEWKMEWLRSSLREAGADIWFGTLGCGAFVEEGQVKGVVVATPEGRGVVLADVVIDSTGNSDIASAAGADCVYTDGSHVGVQGTGLPPRQPGASYTNTDYTLTDDTDAVDIWRSYVAAKEKYSTAYDLGQVIDTRERRRIVGEFTISPLDIVNRRTYPDTVGMSLSNFDTHGFTVHPFFTIEPPHKEDMTAFTPYRALQPKGLEGILVTGLGISAHRDAMPILRMQPDIQNQGYAAGVAAAMAAATGTGTREVDLKALQRHLVENGCLPETVLTDEDPYPLPDEKIAEAVGELGGNEQALGVVLAHRETATPMLREAYAKAEGEAQLVYARVLGMFGDATGADALLAAVSGKEWDEGWTFTGMGQFGGSLSPVDSLLIALGTTGDPRAIPVLTEKTAQLGPESAFSHHRAVAVALEAAGKSEESAAALAALLRKPGMTGHAVTTIGDAEKAAVNADPNLTRNLSLRELILARALFRCGDQDGLGRGILEEYSGDLRGHHARHAAAVLHR